METNPKKTAIAVQTAKVKTESTSLVEVRKNQIVTTSLQIAKYFEKEHKHILRDIRTLECSMDFKQSNFGLSFYHRQLANKGYKKDPIYYITRDGFTFLAMGFTGKVAAKFKEDYINAFNEMEKSLLEIREKGLVSVKLLEKQKEQTSIYKEKSEIYHNLYSQSVESAKLMSKNMPRITDMMMEYKMASQKIDIPSVIKDLKPKVLYGLTDEYYNIAIRVFGEWLNWENTNSFTANRRDTHLVGRLEAARLLFFNCNKEIPTSIRYNEV